MKKFIKNPFNIFLIILLLGFFLRVYHPLYYFQYQHDQDLIGWIIRDIIFNKHFRLIGQETSSQGVFIGPYFYYLLIPFYLITSMNPGGGIIMVTLLGLFSIFSFYYVLSRVFNKKVGLVASLIYAVSYTIIFADREVAPTMPVMLWSVWYFWGIWKLIKGEQKVYILLGFLLGLVWDLNLALILLSPVIILAQFLSKKKPNLKFVLFGIIAFLVTLSPFIAFESRHNFSQTRAITSSVTTDKDYEGGSRPGLAKLDRVVQLVSGDTTRIFWGVHFPERLVRVTLYTLILLFVYLSYKKIIPKKMTTIMFSWLILYAVFFTLNSLNISEYYFHGMNVVWISIASLGIVHLLEKKKFHIYGILLIAAIVGLNLYSYSILKTGRNGYVEKMQLIEFIKKDAEEHNYPCIAISYITSGGYQFGYRYLFWLRGLKVNRPLRGSPVYSIVFPLSFVDSFDKNFGALGLVLPNYGSYTKEAVDKSCEGVEDNLTEPMFGYTQ